MTGILQALLMGYGAVSAAVSDAYFNLVTLLLPGNGTNGAQNNTFLDSSTNNFTITRNGNTTQGTFSPFSQTGWSNYFDGTGDKLLVANNAAFQFGTDNFTVEAWVYVIAAGGYDIIVKCSTDASWASGWGLSCSSSGTGFEFYSNGSSILSSSTGFSLNSWIHVAVTRSGSTNTLWVNGASVATATNSNNLSPTVQLSIGADITSASYDFNGYISNVRVVKGTAVYTANFTPPTAPLTAITNTSLLTCQSNRFIDNSSNAFAITRNGDVSVQAFSPFAPTAGYSASAVGGSGYFDGSGDYLTVANNTAFQLGTGDFTMECWYYAQDISLVAIFGLWGPTSSNASWLMYTDASGNPIWYTSTNGSTHTASLTSNKAITLNAWNHIVIERVSGTTTVYVNGASGGSTSTSINLYAATSQLTIGYNPIGGTPDNVVGYLSGLRLVKGAYVYNGAFTPPTSPPTAVSGTSLLCNFTNAGITDATAKNVLETVGNAQISTTQSKFGGSSMFFDGVGDYLRVPYSKQWALGGDFTIECWLYWTAHDSFGGIVGCANSNTGAAITAGWFFDFNGATNKLQFEGQGGVAIVTTNDIPSGQWNHIAVVRSGSTITHYLNGTANGSGTSSTVFDSNTDPLLVGVDRGFAAEITGYIDDLRITRYARYTANFTPPASAFPLQ